MENYVFDGEEKENKEMLGDDAETSGDDESFMEGYLEDEETTECAECGGAVTPEKKVSKEFEGEEYTFCSANCAEEFEESLAQ
jgi:hypothetical protein